MPADRTIFYVSGPELILKVMSTISQDNCKCGEGSLQSQLITLKSHRDDFRILVDCSIIVVDVNH